jgi:hypothetical protein
VVIGVRKRCLPLTAVVAAAVLAAAVSATAGDDSSNPPSHGLPQVASVEEKARDAMSVLSSPRDAGDAMPADIAERIDRRAPFGMNPALSRRAIGNMTHSVFVIPARDHVCAVLTVGEGANLSCPATDDVAAGRGGAATVYLGELGVAVYGLVPDGVDSVAVETHAGESTRIATTDNAYYTVVPRGTPLSSMRYVGPSGPVEFGLADPTEVFD